MECRSSRSKVIAMYKSVKSLAEFLDCSEKTVQRIVKAMQLSGRYPPETFLVRPRRVKVESVIEFCGEKWK